MNRPGARRGLPPVCRDQAFIRDNLTPSFPRKSHGASEQDFAALRAARLFSRGRDRD